MYSVAPVQWVAKLHFRPEANAGERMSVAVHVLLCWLLLKSARDRQRERLSRFAGLAWRGIFKSMYSSAHYSLSD